MNNYLNNNIFMINMYEKLYADGIKIDEIVDKFRNNKFDMFTGFDYGRFRVFVDSCLMLLNKEKLNKYIKGEYSYASFFDKVENDHQLTNYLSYIKNNPLFSDVKKSCIFYSLAGKEKGAWDQAATIRNAFAHMQYGNFASQESGLMIYFGIYNKDKGIKKDVGIVFEPVWHEFVKGFFSNYSFGIPFKNTFFMRYSLKNNCTTPEFRFYEITVKKNVNVLYDGYVDNTMSELAKQFHKSSDEIISYIHENMSKYEVKEYKVHDKINLNHFKKLAENQMLDTDAKYYYGMKTLLDFETEISNFLIHIGQINSVLYEYSVLRNCGNYTNKQIEDWKTSYEKSINELREDESADLAFKVGFSYLRVMNFVLRTEEDDYEKLDYSKLNVDGFLFSDDSLTKYVEDNCIEKAQKQKYIVDRVRNSLMHGNIDCEITSNGKMLVVFTDLFYSRKDVIKIELHDIEQFLNQSVLYANLPKKTEVLLSQKV